MLPESFLADLTSPFYQKYQHAAGTVRISSERASALRRKVVQCRFSGHGRPLQRRPTISVDAETLRDA